MADDPSRGPSRGHSDTLYEEHEPTEKVERVSITLHGVSQDADVMLRPAPSSALPAQAASRDAPWSSSPDIDGPVFVSMKPPSERGDKTEIVPAIEQPDMRPRLRPVTEPPAWRMGSGALGHYATPRPGSYRKRSWLWLYLVLTLGAGLAGAGVTLWLRSIW